MFFSAKSASCWLYKQAFPQHAAGLYFSFIILPNLKQQTASLTNCCQRRTVTVSYNPLCLALTSEISPSPPKYTYTATQMAGISRVGTKSEIDLYARTNAWMFSIVRLVGIIVVSSLLIEGDEPCWLHFRKCIFVLLRSVTGLKPPQAAFIGVQI